MALTLDSVGQFQESREREHYQNGKQEKSTHTYKIYIYIVERLTWRIKPSRVPSLPMAMAI